MTNPEDLAVVEKSTLKGIADAIREKSGKTNTLLPSNMAEEIAELPSADPDAKYREGYRWNPPTGWPNLRKLVAEMKPEDYGFPVDCTIKSAILFKSAKSSLDIACYDYIVTNDGTAKKKVTGKWLPENIDFDISKDIVIDGFHYKWVVLFTNSFQYYRGFYIKDLVSAVWIVSSHHMEGLGGSSTNASGLVAIEQEDGYVEQYGFYQCEKLEYLRIANFTSPYICFLGCDNLDYIDRNDVDEARKRGEVLSPICNIGSLDRPFQCKSLKEVPRITSGVTGALTANFFPVLANKLCDDIDLRGLTSIGNTRFGSMKYIGALPTRLKVDESFSFASAIMVSKESVATFASDGSVNGGMIGNLNTCPSAEQTVTLNATIKALFTETEQTAIADCLTSKNWGLVW